MVQVSASFNFCHILFSQRVFATMDDHSAFSTSDYDELAATSLRTGVDKKQSEVEEVRNLARKDTNRVRIWRFLVTCVILAMASIVTTTTYRKLIDEQRNAFETAVRDTVLPLLQRRL
jgi:hypothetical protein